MLDAVVGEQVRTVRRSRGVSLRSLATMIGVSPATVSQIENGRTTLSVPRLRRIADALGVSVGHILDAGPEDANPVDARTASPPLPSGPRRRGDWRIYEPLAFDPVLRAALDEFLAIGYHGATVRDIAARAGLSVPGIYHYYTSKQHMLVSVLDHAMIDLLERAEAAQAEGRDPAERFSALVENLALFHTHRLELGFVGAAEKRSLEPGNSERIAAMRTRQQRMVDEEVTAAVHAGTFRSDNAHERARAVVTMCTALPTWWRPDGAYRPEQVAEQYVRFALDLMAPPGRT